MQHLFVVLCATLKPLVNFDLPETKLPTWQNISSWRIAYCAPNIKRGLRNCDSLQFLFELQPLGLSHTFSIGSVSIITDQLQYAEERRKSLNLVYRRESPIRIGNYWAS